MNQVWQQIKELDGTGPIYQRLSNTVRRLIQEQQLKPGEALPSSRQLSSLLSIHRHTVTSALEHLVTQGWLQVQERKGYVVNDLPSDTESRRKHRYKFAHKVNLGGFSPVANTKFNFQSGLPDLREFPLDEYRTNLNESIRRCGPELLDYSSPLGHPYLREVLSNYLEEMRGIKGRTIVVTIGSQEGLYITSRLLLKEGDYVAMEELSYPPAAATFKAAGAKVITLKMDNEGVMPESLSTQLEKYQPKLIFLTPTHQFPTTVNMSAARRLAIYQLCVKHNVPIFEDDYDHEFHFSSTPPQPLASLDQTGHVIYSSTFSKLLFPSARLAFMAIPDEFASEFAQYRRIITHQNEALSQDALARWIEGGGVKTHLRKMRKLYESRLDALEHALATLGCGRLQWDRPEGGMALWLNTGRDADRVASDAAKAGVFVTPENYYRVRKGDNTHLRLGYSNQNSSEIKAGIAALGHVL